MEAFDPSGVGVHNGHFIGLPFTEEDAGVVVLSVPWDVTVSYRAGTATGPSNILACSPQLDLYDPDIPDAWKIGVFLRPASDEWLERNNQLRQESEQYIAFLEEGGSVKEDTEMPAVLANINQGCKDLEQYVYQESLALLQAGKKVGIVGGEHSVPLGFLKALGETSGPFGILQIDAHMDLREAYEGFTLSHASIFHNTLQLEAVTRLVQVGIRDSCEEEWNLVEELEGRVVVFPDQELKESQYEGRTWEENCKDIISHLPDQVYISFDIDGLEPKLCPSTGTPVPGGLELSQVFYLIKQLILSGRKLIGFDLCEVGGIGNEWDGNVGARVLYKLASWLGKQE